MSVFLSYKSSLKFWRSDAPYYRSELIVAPEPGIALAGCIAGVRELRDYASYFDNPGECFDVLVGDKPSRRHARALTLRSISAPLPDGSFFKVANGVYACAPELLFLLAAADLPITSLIALGCELCGTYSLFNPSPYGVKHAQLTDIATMTAFLERAQGMHGIKKARRALKWIADGSASARETDLYMMLCLPGKLGGFALPKASLNTTLDVPQSARALTRLTRITPDLSWPNSGVVVEYESTQTHGAYVSHAEMAALNQEKLASDSERRRTYEAMHLKSLTVTNGEFCSYQEVRRIASLLGRWMGKHGLRSSLSLEAAREDLHAWLKIPVQDRPDTC